MPLGETGVKLGGERRGRSRDDSNKAQLLPVLPFTDYATGGSHGEVAHARTAFQARGESRACAEPRRKKEAKG